MFLEAYDKLDVCGKVGRCEQRPGNSVSTKKKKAEPILKNTKPGL